MKKIIVLNYGLGNVRSVSNALQAIGVSSEISRDKQVILQADALIIPGVGAFPQGMSNLAQFGLIEVINQYINFGGPVLGICLGMQLLFERGSEYNISQGLSHLSGSVEIIPVKSEEGRLPHIAWSSINPSELGRKTMFAGLADNKLRFYFVHSYAATQIDTKNLSATVNYLGHEIVAAVQKENVWGTQFHPEKSGPSGLHVLQNFIKHAEKIALNNSR